MKKIGKVCYGKYEGGILYKESSNSFWIKVNGEEISVMDLHPDPDYEIDSTYYKMSDKEAMNTGFSVGLGGIAGLMAFNGIKGSSSYTVHWLDYSYSNFEIDNADDEDAALQFFKVIKILQFNESFWKNTISKSNLYDEETKALLDWVSKNRKKIVYEMLESNSDDFNIWLTTSQYYNCFLLKISLYNLLNYDFGKGVYSINDAKIIINKIADADTIETLDDVYLNYIPTKKAQTLIENYSINHNNLMEWVQSFNGGVLNFSLFLDNVINLIKNNSSLEEVTIYMFKEQSKFFYTNVKAALKK